MNERVKAQAELEAVQAARLQRTLHAVALAHPFYRQHFRQHGIDSARIRSLDDLAALPPTRKEDLHRRSRGVPPAARRSARRLRADRARALGHRLYDRHHQRQAVAVLQHHPRRLRDLGPGAALQRSAEGVRPTDRIANLYPLADFPTGAFLSVIRSGMIAGIPVMNGLTGSAQSEFKVRHSLAEALDKVAAFRPTVLWGVPSFVRRFLDEGQAPGPRLLRRPSRHHLGRAGAARAARRDEGPCWLPAGQAAVEFRARYAFTEMQGGLVQCAEDAPGQNVTPRSLLS